MVLRMGEGKPKQTNITVFGYMFCQVALLITRYGFEKMMPWWITWFPSLFVLVVMCMVLLVFLIAIGIALVLE